MPRNVKLLCQFIDYCALATHIMMRSRLFARPVAQVLKRTYITNPPPDPIPPNSSNLVNPPNTPKLILPPNSLNTSQLKNPLVIPPLLPQSRGYGIAEVAKVVLPKLACVPDTEHEYAELYTVANDVQLKIQDGTSYVAGLKELKSKRVSRCSLDAMAALGMYFSPTNNVDEVLPKEFEPTDKDLALYNEILNPKLNRAMLADISLWNSTDIPRHTDVYRIAQTMNKLLDPVGTKLYEVQSDRLIRDVFDSLNWYDRREAINYIEGHQLTMNLFGNIEKKTQLEFLFYLRTLTAMFGFSEDKRLGVPSSNVLYPFAFNFEISLAQKALEAIALALNNDKYGYSFDQEIFGICVRHFYFTFWHAYIPKVHLGSLKSGPHSNSFGVLKCYPASQYGLDFSDPTQRCEIYKFLLRIAKYAHAKQNII